MSLPREAPAGGYDAEMVAHVVELTGKLIATHPEGRLLHGDFHPANVLSATREPWSAIDCKPLLGDPAFDLAQWLGNRCEVVEKSPDAVVIMRRADRTNESTPGPGCISCGRMVLREVGRLGLGPTGCKNTARFTGGVNNDTLQNERMLPITGWAIRRSRRVTDWRLKHFWINCVGSATRQTIHCACSWRRQGFPWGGVRPIGSRPSGNGGPLAAAWEEGR